jgi:hypothetical protein
MQARSLPAEIRQPLAATLPYFSLARALVLYLTLLKYQAGLGIGYFSKLAYEPSLSWVLGTL